MTAVSMAFILGGSVVRIGIAEKGGTRGGLLVGLVVFIAAISIFANLDTVKDADLPILAIANQIHPWLAYIYIYMQSQSFHLFLIQHSLFFILLLNVLPTSVQKE